jgi:rhamnulose-1-phosphate aldolase
MQAKRAVWKKLPEEGKGREMNEKFETLLSQVGSTANEIWLRGWAEANAGNISVRIERDILPEKSAAEGGWKEIGRTLPEIAGDFFLVSGTGTYLKNFQRSPSDNLGIIEIDSTGGKYRVIWGCRSGRSPTSELITHLQAHSTRKAVSENKDRAVLHTHCPHLTAIGCIEKLNTEKLTSLLWQIHTECLILLPDGVEYIPWIMPGSAELADATAKGFAKRHVVVWQFHGIIAAGADLDKILGLIGTVEKTCGMYLQAKAAGGIKNKISKRELIEISKRFNLTPDEGIMSAIG